MPSITITDDKNVASEFDITPEQWQSLEDYRAIPQHVDWKPDPKSGQNMPVYRYASVVDLLMESFCQRVKAAVDTCPNAAMQAAIAERQAAEQKLADAAVLKPVTRVTPGPTPGKP